MKKIIGLILCVATTLLVLVSCGDGDHVHNYNRNEWAKDATHHWYAAECDCEDAGVASKAEHVDKTMVDGFCDVCGYKVCTNTAYSTEYTFNANSHWKNPLCNHVGSTAHIRPVDIEPHDFEIVSGVATCKDCGYECKNTEYSTEWESDENTHWHEPMCGHVDAHGKRDEAAHVFDAETGECECGYKCPGVYGETWTTDDNNHWKDPTCGHTIHSNKDLAPHVDENGDGKCDTCDIFIPTPDPVE